MLRNTFLYTPCFIMQIFSGVCKVFIYSSVHSGSGRLQRRGNHVTCYAATRIDVFLFKNWHYVVSAGFEGMIRLFSIIILEL